MISKILGGLAGGTTVNTVFDKMSHTCPPERSGEEFICFEVTGMARAGCIMMEGDDVMAEFWVMGDV